ncbi:MAG TPA: S8 family serine peptidase [Thermoanaerobaculia bacterium]|nr:S8 family serine peptidase [Thermoanaerobaculia bacterium]
MAAALPAAAAPDPAAPLVWNLELARGRTAKTTVTVVNRCFSAHAFQTSVEPAGGFLSFPEPSSPAIPPGKSVSVAALVDARTLDPGEHRELVTVRCADCGSEPACAQNRDVFDARLKVMWSEEDVRRLSNEDAFASEVLVAVNTSADAKALRQLEKKLSLEPESSFELPSIGWTVRVLRIAGGAASAGPVEAVAALQKDPAVRLAQPNFRYRVEADPAVDPYRKEQWALDRLGAEKIHERTTGRGVTVAILDSFVNAKHEDFARAVAETADFFRKSFGTVKETHGTAMAGIVAARSRNGVAIAGIAPEATLLSVRVCGALPGEPIEVCSSEALARGLDLAIARKARVVNMSLAGPYDPLVARLVYRAGDAGMLLVAATGNDGLVGTVKYPAALDPVLAVTAIDSEDRLYAKANQGSRVDVAAPGVGIFTLAPYDVEKTTGTSPAAAHVSGAAALLIQLRPEISPPAVRRLLQETARDLGPPGRDDQFGSGAIDLCRAIAKLTGDDSVCR